MADSWNISEPTTFELYSNSIGSLPNPRDFAKEIQFTPEESTSQCDESSPSVTQNKEAMSPSQRVESEEEQMRRDFDNLDTKRLGVLGASDINKIISTYIQRVDLPTVERLMRNFAGGSSTIGFSNLLIIYQFLKKIKLFFQFENTLPANQAPSILQSVLTPDQHMFISFAIQKWLKSYYTEKLTHQGLRGLAQNGFRDLDRPLDPKDGLNFHNILNMALDAIEKKSSMSPFS